MPVSQREIKYGDFQAWATVVNNILTCWGHTSFLANIDATNEEFDARFQHLRDIAETFHTESGTADQWEGRLVEARMTDLWGRHWRDMTPRARQTALGKVFSSYVGREFAVPGHGVLVRVRLNKTTVGEWGRPLYSWQHVER